MHNIVLSPIGIENLVSLIAEEVVRKMSNKSDVPQERLIDLKEACEFTKLSRQTIYNKVALREIPHQRKNGRLYFSSTELMEWIKSGKRKTITEIKEQADDFLNKKGGANG